MNDDETRVHRGEDAAMSEGPEFASSDYRPCSRCAEPIRQEASVCRYCGADVGATEDLPTTKRSRLPIAIGAGALALLLIGGAAALLTTGGESREVTAVKNKLDCSDFEDDEEQEDSLNALAVCASKRAGQDLGGLLTGDSGSGLETEDLVDCLEFGDEGKDQEFAECLLDKGL